MRRPDQSRHASDLSLLARVQEENRREIIDKLLHDLRNPVHSIRITVELFARLARRSGDFDKLIELAGQYIGPAQAAVNALQVSTERLGMYLAPAALPEITAVRLQEWFGEIAALLRGGMRERQIELSTDVDSDLQFAADRPRLSHTFLRFSLDGAPVPVSLAARSEGEVVRIELSLDSDGGDLKAAQSPASSLTLQELRLLIENAGGEVAIAEKRRLSVSFKTEVNGG